MDGSLPTRTEDYAGQVLDFVAGVLDARLAPTFSEVATAYAKAGAYDPRTGKTATKLYSDAARRRWFATAFETYHEGEIVSIGIPAKTYRVTWLAEAV
jgi:hypothetical protein